MKLLFERTKFRDCDKYDLGCLVTLTQQPTDSEVVPCVGHYVCVRAKLPVPELESLGIVSPDWAESLDSAKKHFPGGCDVGRGIWVSDNRTPIEELWKVLKTKTSILEVFSPQFLAAVSSDDIKCFRIDSGSLNNEDIEIIDAPVQQYLQDNTVLCQISTSLPLYIPQVSGQVLSAMRSIERFVNDPSTVFSVSSNSMIFSESTNISLKASSLKTKSTEKIPVIPSSAREIAHVVTGPTAVQLLTDHSITTGAPSLTISKPLPGPCMKMSLPIDVLALVHCDMPLKEVAACLRNKIIAFLQAVTSAIAWKEGSCCTITVHHLALWNQHCLVTVVYPHHCHSWEQPDQPSLITTDDLGPYRESLYEKFCLGLGLPCLRISRQPQSKLVCSWLSSNLGLCSGPQLLNPHTHLKKLGKEGTMATVQGDYLYYHYMQGGFNDDGWGCAYRSLQTLWSWFMLQGYTTKPPPTHREIQESLVEAKERESSLIGSRDWIGSLEVQSCLNQLLNVSSRIQTCDRGSDMASVGRVLLHHFRKQGTPVMIGGGVLAHTILGVNFSEVTGSTQFLILDPHYTGREDIKTITDKGKWCGWKEVSFWDQKAFYNLCMPFRSTDVL